MGRPAIQDFDKPLPERDVELGELDGFTERGRALLMLEMIGQAAEDVCGQGQVKAADHKEALEWVSDSSNIAAWLALVGGDPALAPAISQAILTRPREISHACSIAVRSVRTNEDGLLKFMAALGMNPLAGISVSSLYSATLRGSDGAGYDDSEQYDTAANGAPMSCNP